MIYNCEYDYYLLKIVLYIKAMSLLPKRNFMVFNGADFPFDICNDSLKNIHKHLLELVPEIFNKQYDIELRANKYNYSLRIMGIVLKNTIKNILDHKYECLELVYFELRGKVKTAPFIYIHNYFKCEYGIFYNPLSFRQPDDTIRINMIQIIKQFATFESMCFIGGECTLFGKLLTYKKALFYTDFYSIYEDIVRNIHVDNENIKANFINYNTYNIADEINEFMSDDKYCMILNTGTSGLGMHLAKQLSKTLATQIIIISCNRNSFCRDAIILETGGFRIQQKHDIKTNYEINIYVLG